MLSLRDPRASDDELLAGPQFTALSSAERKALAITSTLETGRAGGFFGLTGNFDGMGLSFGLLNWNIGAGSLQPLLRDLFKRFPDRWRAAFRDDADRLRQVIEPAGTAATQAQLAFVVQQMNAQSVDSRTGAPVWRIVEPWISHFRRLSEDSEFQAIQVRTARELFNCARYWCEYFGLTTERAFCMMFDAVSSHGKAWLRRKDNGVERRRQVLREKLAALTAAHGAAIPQSAKLRAIAEALGETSRPEYRAKALERKLWFLTGVHRRAAELRGLEPTDAPLPASTAPASCGAGVIAAPASPIGTSRYLTIDLRIAGAQPMTGVFTPHGYQPRTATDVILYLHGHHGPLPISSYWSAVTREKTVHAPLREGLENSRKNVVLIAPTLDLRSEIGALGQAGGLDRYLDQVIAAAGLPPLRHLIVAAHSGGGVRMHRIAHLKQRTVDHHLRECWSFDSLNNPAIDETWAAWAARHPDKVLRDFHATDGPSKSAARLAKAVAAKQLGNVILKRAEARRDPHWDMLSIHWTPLIDATAFLDAR